MMNKSLKIKLIILSLIFPLSLIFIGLAMGFYLYSHTVAIILGIAGLIMGILLNYICYYRKLFAIALYQAPIPLIMFLLVWWISNIFIKDLYAFFFAIGGLLIGLWLNAELIFPYQFYKVKKRILAIIYLFLSLGFLGFFMGVPAFNILLGVLAGNYLSIRVISNYKNNNEIKINLKQGAAFTSGVLFIITLLSAFLAYTDKESSILVVQQLFNIQLNPTSFFILIVLGGIVIVTLQYFITLYTAKTMLQLWRYRRIKRIVKN